MQATATPPPGSPRPRMSNAEVMLLMLAPLIGIGVATAFTGISLITVLATSLAALVPMLVARSFVVTLGVRPQDEKQSLFQAHFGMEYGVEYGVTSESAGRIPEMRWYERLYAPVVAGASGGLLAEIGRVLFYWLQARLPLEAEVLLAAAAVGALSGVLLVLAAALGWALVSFVVSRRVYRRLHRAA